ncbi:MAG: hypothetical protein GZ094_02135 [Mariniphaga sp.]|nr:hypothetical protein [Mariniphaga sp.]
MNPVFEFAKSISVETICYGSWAKLQKRLSLRAGKLTMIYENGSLRTISTGEFEIVRMIYSAVRGKAWLTVEPEITHEEIDIQENSFQIKYNCHYRLADIDFIATYSIKGDADSSLSFEMEGEALTTFQKCRIGFCLLHPVEECTSKKCIITQSNEVKENATFPVNISPSQPFKDIKTMEWKVSDCRCTVEFHGDIFETEDHRNWTDASFKTYCTPLNLPYPSTVQKGEKIRQKIFLKVAVENFKGSETKSANQIVLFPDQLKPLPQIGIGQSTRPQKMSSDEVSIIKTLSFDHYRIDLYLFEDNWKVKAAVAIEGAIMLNYPLMFALFLDEHALQQAHQFIDWVLAFDIKIGRVILFHQTIQSTPDSLTDSIAPLFRSRIAGVKIGCGTNANFAQLNRNRPESDKADFISYSIHPQEHATDNQSLVENLKAQEYTVESAMQFAHGKEVWVSPVNLQRRFNANLENFEHTFIGETIPPQVDARLMSLFGAGWSAISLKHLLESGLNGCTYFETVGERGLFQGETDSRWPVEFRSVAGMIFPVFHIFKFILANKGFQVMKSQSSQPLFVDSLVLSDGLNIRAMVVNFTALPQMVEILGCREDWNIKSLDPDSFALAASSSLWLDKEPVKRYNLRNNLSLSPFSINFIDGFLKL